MKIVQGDPRRWDELIDHSTQGTAFQRRSFLEACGQQVVYLLCVKGDNVLAGMSFFLEGANAVPGYFQQYSGLVFSRSLQGNSFTPQDKRFKVSQIFAEYLAGNYASVWFQNHWSVPDIRPFDWHNYHTPELGRYAITVRYTSILTLEAGVENGDGFASVRRRIARNTRTKNQETQPSADLDILLALYRKTFSRQGIDVPSRELETIQSVGMRCLQEGTGALYLTTDAGRPGTSSFFLLDRHGAYYLFGASDPDMRDLETGTRNMVDAMTHLRDVHHCPTLDFVGVNSPGRGWFKASFGGTTVPYYGISR
ncbi:hypothetical protein NNJEOMEG_02697 [Fundidesulfovibrio magnetotacticus]|uniref:BioF2-like acetyltransferase domain-containing protein n=1 Tax=Fundidesulfovibrio magnetotacticus TaxID=2730080 RepID=A0A6V8LXS0_9BACT|nr:GNAT family N-acetyltransferase [Fundidesulfovibrio magnetotacticus]GFK94849.1 hypothetical protein NNJEOMEG_02697 [Fundidesulfovibrio magnetotacticus]